MISPELQDAPNWAKEHIEGIDRVLEEHRDAALETRLPGLSAAFMSLVEKLPDPNGIYRKPSEFPVAGAVIRLGSNGRVETISSALNQVNARQDSTAHGEFLALQEAEAVEGQKHLYGHYLLSTMEPCMMCCGAAVNCGIEGVIYAASHEDVKGQYARIGDEFRLWRTSPEGFDADAYLTRLGLEVVSGYKREDALRAITRTPVSMGEYYRDPDA